MADTWTGKNRGGRPPKPDDEKRWVRKDVYVTPPEDDLIIWAAEMSGEKITSFMRKAALRRARELRREMGWE